MTIITAQMVKDLREQTGLGILECKKALEAAGGDYEDAVKAIRQRGQDFAIRKVSKMRPMQEGIIEVWIAESRKLGAMVEVNCETDFVANTGTFKLFAKEVTFLIGMLRPKTIDEAMADLKLG